MQHAMFSPIDQLRDSHSPEEGQPVFSTVLGARQLVRPLQRQCLLYGDCSASPVSVLYTVYMYAVGRCGGLYAVTRQHLCRGGLQRAYRLQKYCINSRRAVIIQYWNTACIQSIYGGHLKGQNRVKCNME